MGGKCGLDGQQRKPDDLIVGEVDVEGKTAAQGGRHRHLDHRRAVDLYLLHGPPLEVLRDAEPWEALERAVEAGKARHAGVSVRSGSASEALDVVLDVLLVRVVQLKYSLAQLDAARYARRMADAGRTVVARVPFGHGVLLGKYVGRTEFAAEDHCRRGLSDEWIARANRFRDRLRAALPERAVNPVEVPLLWPLGDPAVYVTICGATDPSQVRGIAEAAGRPPLSAGERTLVERIADECFASARVSPAGA